MDLLDVMRFVWTKSPQDHWRRLVGAAEGPLWASGKHRQWNRLPYYLRAFQVVAEHHGQRLEFSGRKVLEFGPGPVLGFAPFALIEGAASVTLVDATYQDLRDNRQFQIEYLFPLFRTHSRLTRGAGPPDFESFLSKLRQMEVRLGFVEQFQAAPGHFDLVLSKSCIDYITGIDRAVDICHEASTTGSLHFHYVDFSMYRRVDRIGSPFGKGYQQSRESNPEYFKNRGGDLNLLRPSDIVAAFERRFRKVYFFALADYRGQVDLDRVHPDWAHYQPDDLAIANGVLLAIK